MISFTEAQILGWITPLLWPFLRALALFTALPVLGTRTVPARVRIGLAAFVALAAQASLPAVPAVALDSPAAFILVLQQLVVGLALGFSVRLVFAAVEFAGEIIGLQMGLNFASFFDPTSNAQVSAVARFFGNIAMLLFIVINGHLMVLMAALESFERFPVDGHFMQAVAQMRLHELGAGLFASALWIALPMMALLLFVNLTLGIISRVAPQMNIFAVGFPVTLTVGMLGITATLPMLEQPMLTLLQQAVDIFQK